MDGGGEDASAKKKHKTSADRTIDYYHSLSLSLTYLRPVSPPPPPPPPEFSVEPAPRAVGVIACLSKQKPKQSTDAHLSSPHILVLIS